MVLWDEMECRQLNGIDNITNVSKMRFNRRRFYGFCESTEATNFEYRFGRKTLKTCYKMLSANEGDKGLMRRCLLEVFGDKIAFTSSLTNQFSGKWKVDNKDNMRRHISKRVNDVEEFLKEL